MRGSEENDTALWYSEYLATTDLLRRGWKQDHLVTETINSLMDAGRGGGAYSKSFQRLRKSLARLATPDNFRGGLEAIYLNVPTSQSPGSGQA